MSGEINQALSREIQKVVDEATTSENNSNSR